MSDSALLKAARANDVTIVADKDHTDPAIINHVTAQLEVMVKSGVRHLYLEQDLQEKTVQQMVKGNSNYDRLAAQAQRVGMQVHLYDDRSLMRAVNARYPAAAAHAEKHDYYLEDPDALIAGAPDREEMRRYIEARVEAEASPARNASMVRNIDRDLRQHPGEKAVVVLGAWHLEQRDDVDEGLRRAGHQVSTIEVKSQATRVLTRGPDFPDVIANTETGQAVTYKPTNPDATYMIRLQPGAEPPSWRREEPAPATDPTTAALQGHDIAAMVQCSHDPSNTCSPADTGTMGRVGTQNQSQTQETAIQGR